MRDLPQRKKLRLTNFDYSTNGLYFITICTKNRENFFGEIIHWMMNLNEYWKIAEKNWGNILNHYQNVDIDEFVIMPNHIHWIIVISVGNEYFRSGNNDESQCSGNNDEIQCSENWDYISGDYCPNNWNENLKRNEDIRSPRPNISNIIKWFKIWCTTEIRNTYNDFLFAWQKSFYDVIIKNDHQLNITRQYILNNPIKWEWDKHNSHSINLPT